jgi:hypothetical protein
MPQFPIETFNAYVDEVKQMCEAKDLMGKVNQVLSESWTEVNSNFKEKCSAGASDKFTSQELQDSINYLSTVIRPTERVKFVPEPDCKKQVVLGLSENIASYFMYNQESGHEDTFLILADKDWSDEGNNLYVRCAIYSELSTNCKYPVRILLPKDKNELFKIDTTGAIQPRVTIFELITLQEIFNGKSESRLPSNYQLRNNLYTTVEDYSFLPYNIIFIKNPYYDKSDYDLIRDKLPTGVTLPFRQKLSFNSNIRNDTGRLSKGSYRTTDLLLNYGGEGFGRKTRRRKHSRGKRTRVNRRGKRTHNNMKKRKHKTRRH